MVDEYFMLNFLSKMAYSHCKGVIRFLIVISFVCCFWGTSSQVVLTIDSVEENKTAIMKCNFATDPTAIFVKWYKDPGRMLLVTHVENYNGSCLTVNDWTSRNCTSIWSGTLSEVMLESVRLIDDATYVCETSNKLQDAEKMNVTVTPSSVVISGETVPAGDPVTKLCTVDRFKPLDYLEIIWKVDQMHVTSSITNTESTNDDSTFAIISKFIYETSCDLTKNLQATCEVVWKGETKVVSDESPVITGNKATYCDDDGLSTPEIAGIVIGCLVVVLVIVAIIVYCKCNIVIFCCWCSKKVKDDMKANNTR